jgi:hypothetical protein
MKLHRTRGLAVLASGLLILGLTAGAGASPHFRPFSATLDGFAGPMPTADPCVLANAEHGTGNARHMGSITWVSNETVNLCSNPAGGDVVGQLTITAANGDLVNFSYQTLAHLDFSTNEVSASGNWAITGGTGRFAGASGHGVITANGSLLPPFEVLGGMSGVIAY